MFDDWHWLSLFVVIFVVLYLHISVHPATFMLLLQARSLLYQFRLLPRIPCSLHDLCKLCGPGMWDSRYIPTVECSGEHPDSQSCPYGGTSTPQPSSPSPSTTPSPSPNPTPTPPPEGKKGSKTRDIFTFRKQSWGGGYGELFLVLAHVSTAKVWIHLLDSWNVCCHLTPDPAPSFTILMSIFVTWSLHVVQCRTLPYQNVIWSVRYLINLQWGWIAVGQAKDQQAVLLLKQNGQSSATVLVWSSFRFFSAAGLAYIHGLCRKEVTLLGSEATDLNLCGLWPQLKWK